MFSIWTDRTAKESITFMDLSVGKVHIFWEGHKNMMKFSKLFLTLLIPNKTWTFRQILVAFLECMNFKYTGKYKNVKMAFVNLANERDMYLNFNTESTALCLESLG